MTAETHSFQSAHAAKPRGYYLTAPRFKTPRLLGFKLTQTSGVTRYRGLRFPSAALSQARPSPCHPRGALTDVGTAAHPPEAGGEAVSALCWLTLLEGQGHHLPLQKYCVGLISHIQKPLCVGSYFHWSSVSSGDQWETRHRLGEAPGRGLPLLHRKPGEREPSSSIPPGPRSCLQTSESALISAQDPTELARNRCRHHNA